MSTIASLWRENMLGYLSLDFMFLDRSSQFSLPGTEGVHGKVSQHISASNGGYCLYTHFKLFLALLYYRS